MPQDPLFEPLRLGALSLTHRVVMAPLTRMRSRQPGDVPVALNAEYYGQRASRGGLVITEATDVSEQARGYSGAPGIHSAEQVAGWRGVTDAIHAKGGFAFVQLWHTGRISHSSMQPGGTVPVSASAVAAPGQHVNAGGEPVLFETPRPLREDELPGIVAQFRAAAENTRVADFDGVEIHSANGYLLDQFPQKRHEPAHGPLRRLLRQPLAAAGGSGGRRGRRARRRPRRRPHLPLGRLQRHAGERPRPARCSTTSRPCWPVAGSPTCTSWSRGRTRPATPTLWTRTRRTRCRASRMPSAAR